MVKERVIEMSKILGFFGKIGSKFSALSKAQKVVTAAVTATSLVVAGGGAVLVSSMGNGNAFGTETSGTEFLGNAAEEVVGEITVKIETVSIEKDLKIKVVDESGAIVTGFPFEFSVAQLTVDDEEEEVEELEKDETTEEISNAEVVDEEINMDDYDFEEYVDDDMDGIVHIINLKGGEFLVQMHEMDGFLIEADTVKTKVKGKLEYKKVDVENEVKKESEVNTAVEDTAVNNVVVEAVLADTLPLLATHAEAKVVDRNNVDMSNFPKSSKNPDQDTKIPTKVIKYCTSHVEVETKTDEKPATCTEAGSYVSTKTCSVCGTVTSNANTVEIPALGHTAGTPVEENRVEAQIGVAGSYDSVTYCSICNTEMSRESVTIPALTDPNANTGGVTGTGDQTGTPPTGPASTEPAGQSEEEPEVTTKRYMGNSIVALANGVKVASAVIPVSEIDPQAETGSPENPGASQNGVPYVVDASATVSMPYVTKVYLHSEEARKITWDLGIKDENGVIIKNEIFIASRQPEIAEVKYDKETNKVTVKGNKAGTATVGVTIGYSTVDANNNKTKAYYDTQFIVTVDDYSGDQAVQIKDKEGNPLYIDEKCTKPATPAHFTNVGILLYGSPVYTGWNVINGKLYYFTADHKPATGYQVIGGVAYTFNSDGSVQAGNQSLGIDVSKWQGNIDWTAVAQSGVKFAIIRCAYRGASTGVIVEDPYFRQNIKGATANGIKVGVYFFTQAVNEYEAVEEASTAIGLVSGYNISYPIFIDTENATNGRANGLDVGTRTAVVRAFCETVRSAGYKPGIYASKNWYYQKLDMSQLSTYNIWVAQYNTSCNYTGRYDIWQYSSDGSIPGINGRVDVNIGYTNY